MTSDPTKPRQQAIVHGSALVALVKMPASAKNAVDATISTMPRICFESARVSSAMVKASTADRQADVSMSAPRGNGVSCYLDLRHQSGGARAGSESAKAITSST